MTKKLRSYSPEFKLKVALEASKEMNTVSQIASEYSIHSARVSEWKKHLIENGSKIFQGDVKSKKKEKSDDVEFLQQQIGKLSIELAWLKKKHAIIC